MMSIRVAKEYLHLQEWIRRVGEVVDSGEDAYLSSHLLSEAGDSLLMKMGEAASRLARLGIPSPPGISWTDAINQRNWPIHQYDHVDRTVTWATLTRDIPRWAEALRPRFVEAESRVASSSR